MIKNTTNSYGSITRILHWVVSIAIISIITVGFIMADMEPSEQKWQLYGMHEATGVVILLLVTLRLMWKLINVNVLMPNDMPKWQKTAAYLTHMTLYIFMFVMPISGIFMTLLGGHDISFYGLFNIPAFAKNEELSKLFYTTHTTSALILTGLIALHFLAGMYHHFIRKDNTLIRMIKGSSV